MNIVIEKIKLLLKDNKKRHLVTLMFVLPFIVIIGICGANIYKQAKGLIGMAGESGNTAINSNYSINNNSFVLRENATDLQKEYFKELKDIYENPSSEASDADKAASTVKNFIADFYTWSNKLGQYDVGGMYYVYQPQRSTIYIQSRDQFYKYINQYINKYGSEALLEVESVETTVDETPFAFEIDECEFGCYKVKANWTYVAKENDFDTSKYQNSGYFLVLNNAGRYELAYIGDKEFEYNKESENNEE